MRRVKTGLGGVLQGPHRVLLGQRSYIVFLPLSPAGNGVKPRPFPARWNAKRNWQEGGTQQVFGKTLAQSAQSL